MGFVILELDFLRLRSALGNVLRFFYIKDVVSL